jgi:hypothetical protein
LPSFLFPFLSLSLVAGATQPLFLLFFFLLVPPIYFHFFLYKSGFKKPSKLSLSPRLL